MIHIVIRFHVVFAQKRLQSLGRFPCMIMGYLAGNVMYDVCFTNAVEEECPDPPTQVAINSA